MLAAATAANRAGDRAATRSRLNRIAFALAGYRADHDGYPESLAELAPKYIAEVPVDLFTGNSYRYKLEDEGFLIYSLGPNMQDNGGRNRYVARDKPAPGEDKSEWDDYRLRIPPEDN